ncbi:MAG TPA: stage II sporulation protein M [archaeon]|nr:stage II sporulation protein M [archaeon]
MLESLLRPKTAEKKPWDVFFIAIFFSIIGVAFSLQLFPSQASVFSVSLITIMFMPFFQKLFAVEEKKDYKLHSNLLMRHRQLFYVFGTFFIGTIVALSFIYVFFPSARGAFSLQESWYSSQGTITGNAVAENDFTIFLLNNTQVLIITFALSAIFGAGAVFILVWNASVIAVYVGFVINNFIRDGISPQLAYVLGVPLGLGSIALHGIPEIGAYFVAALAGGMLSVGIIREKLKGHFKKIFADSLLFLALAEVLIVIAALLEAYV